MSTALTATSLPDETPLGRALRLLHQGKTARKPLPATLLESCRAALLDPDSNAVQRGAFLGALLTLGPTPEERALESCYGKSAFSHPTFLVNKLWPDLPAPIHAIAVKLLRRHTLRVSEAQQLGETLLAPTCPSDFFGLFATVLRVRHETNDEYRGLFQAAQETYTPGFRPENPSRLKRLRRMLRNFRRSEPPAPSRQWVQITDTFDGAAHHYLTTPLLAHLLRERGYDVLSLVGTGRGPGVCNHDLLMLLGCPFLQSRHELDTCPAPFGWALEQKALSPALSGLTDKHLLLGKPYFIHTLEKILNPGRVQMLITCARQPDEQMQTAELALMAGYDAVLVLRQGLEGSLTPSTHRGSTLLCAVRTDRDHLFFQHFGANLPQFAEFRHDEPDALVTNLQSMDNVRLIKQWLAEGETANDDFDRRAALTRALFSRGLEWIESQRT